jgi:hypothetical protein
MGWLGTLAVKLWQTIFGDEIEKELARKERLAKAEQRKAEAARKKANRAREQRIRAENLFRRLEQQAIDRERAAKDRRISWQKHLADQGIVPQPIDSNPYESSR